jgi:CheY-like chemotaxis protein
MARILLVDDEALLRRTLRAVLEKAGHSVAEAADGALAVEMFKAAPFDLVLTDIIMPNREGVETIRDLREIDPDLPIIAISGGGASGGGLFLKLAGQLGADRTLAKPVRPAELVAVVESLLEGKASL